MVETIKKVSCMKDKNMLFFYLSIYKSEKLENTKKLSLILKHLFYETLRSKLILKQNFIILNINLKIPDI